MSVEARAGTGPIGFVGLGQMGRPMVRCLTSAGSEIHGYDADPGVTAESVADGIVPAGSIADLAARCPTVILMLPNSDIVDAVAGQLATAADHGVCRRIIDMGSSEPERTRRLAEQLVSAGIELVDAPVSGGVGAARTGTLTIMAGGTADQYRETAALLAPLGSSITHVGPVGAGHALKALNNLMSACSLVITAEAMTVATRFGIAPATALAVVNTASGRSGSTEAKFPKFVLTGAFDSGFSAALMDKDVGIANRLADDLSIETPLAEAVAHRWHELTTQLARDADHTEIVKPLEARAGVQIRTDTGD